MPCMLVEKVFLEYAVVATTLTRNLGSGACHVHSSIYTHAFNLSTVAFTNQSYCIQH